MAGIGYEIEDPQTIGYTTEEVPESAEPGRSRHALNKSATGQTVTTARAQTQAWQRLLQTLESSLVRLDPAPVTVEVPRIIVTAEGEYVLQPWHTIRAQPEYKNLRPTRFAESPQKVGGALVDEWLANVDGFADHRDDQIAEAFRTAAERERPKGYDLTLLNKLLLRALTLRAGIKLDLSRY